MGEDAKKLEPLYTVGEKMAHPLWKTLQQFLTNLNVELLYLWADTEENEKHGLRRIGAPLRS